MSSYMGRALGGIEHLGTLILHENRNVISGEGGATLMNDAKLARRTEIFGKKAQIRAFSIEEQSINTLRRPCWERAAD